MLDFYWINAYLPFFSKNIELPIAVGVKRGEEMLYGGYKVKRREIINLGENQEYKATAVELREVKKMGRKGGKKKKERMLKARKMSFV